MRILPVLLVTVLILGNPCLVFCEENCEKVIHQLNKQLAPKIDEDELVAVIRSLNESGNRKLPAKFVTKRQAKKMGWRPGKSLWSSSLAGKSIGGDVFRDRERQLPNGRRKWREADLGYRGGHRGAKRVIFSDDGLRVVTVDHYRSFTEVPACR